MITFVATAYQETYDIYQFLSCLFLQTNQNWKCIIYCDTKNEFIENAIKFYNDDRIKYVYRDTPSMFWGHYNRKDALDNMVDTEFVIQTSVQDYYTPNTVDEILKISDNFDFIYFDCIHNHKNHDVLITKPKICQIDWGCFAIRTELAKLNGINNLTSEMCDGIFVEECFRNLKLRVHKINKILTVHN
jgi:hypothetical protein